MSTPDTPPQDAPARRRLSPSWAPRAIFECLLIVFSVVLALSLNDWAADRREAERAGQLREALIAEITANRALLADDHYLPHHLGLREAIIQGSGRPDSPVDRATAMRTIGVLFSTGLHPVRLRDAAWRSAGASDLIAYIPMQEAFLLSEIYRAQEDLETLNRTGYDVILGLSDLMDGQTAHTPHLMRLSLYLEDMINQEQTLLSLYDQALAHMNATSPTARDSEAR